MVPAARCAMDDAREIRSCSSSPTLCGSLTNQRARQGMSTPRYLRKDDHRNIARVPTVKSEVASGSPVCASPLEKTIARIDVEAFAPVNARLAELRAKAVTAFAKFRSSTIAPTEPPISCASTVSSSGAKRLALTQTANFPAAKQRAITVFEYSSRGPDKETDVEDVRKASKEVKEEIDEDGTSETESSTDDSTEESIGESAEESTVEGVEIDEEAEEESSDGGTDDEDESETQISGSVAATRDRATLSSASQSAALLSVSGGGGSAGSQGFKNVGRTPRFDSRFELISWARKALAEISAEVERQPCKLPTPAAVSAKGVVLGGMSSVEAATLSPTPMRFENRSKLEPKEKEMDRQPQIHPSVTAWGSGSSVLVGRSSSKRGLVSSRSGEIREIQVNQVKLQPQMQSEEQEKEQDSEVHGMRRVNQKKHRTEEKLKETCLLLPSPCSSPLSSSRTHVSGTFGGACNDEHLCLEVPPQKERKVVEEEEEVREQHPRNGSETREVNHEKVEEGEAGEAMVMQMEMREWGEEEVEWGEADDQPVWDQKDNKEGKDADTKHPKEGEEKHGTDEEMPPCPEFPYPMASQKSTAVGRSELSADAVTVTFANRDANGSVARQHPVCREVHSSRPAVPSSCMLTKQTEPCFLPPHAKRRRTGEVMCHQAKPCWRRRGVEQNGVGEICEGLEQRFPSGSFGVILGQRQRRCERQRVCWNGRWGRDDINRAESTRPDILRRPTRFSPCIFHDAMASAVATAAKAAARSCGKSRAVVASF
eukprot:TRINITY_DN27309_c0_g2_i1.p1 TRINITY_DN27309_c0_g2~~TRINITY_DN27309_c0_g2_i1.p1  ORF type:complete len:769 (-),score=134.38 TRINITY_DN27309_c0_g2_i1:582-2888(-)